MSTDSTHSRSAALAVNEARRATSEEHKLITSGDLPEQEFAETAGSVHGVNTPNFE